MRLKKPVKRQRRGRFYEDAEAQRLWIWACSVPELRDHLYHVPNGGKRDGREAARMKGMGVRAGVSDYHLPVARGLYNGLWVELKATPPNDAALQDSQEQWLQKMRVQGYAAFVCLGLAKAKAAFVWYLSLPRRPVNELCGSLYFDDPTDSEK